MKNIKPYGTINEVKKTSSYYITRLPFSKMAMPDLVEEIYNTSNKINFMIDEGIMDKNGKIKKKLTIEDVLDAVSDKFEASWNSIEEAEGTFEDLKSACGELYRR